MPRDEGVQDLNDLFSASMAVRRQYDWQAYLNIAFMEGNQWVAWDGNQLWEPPVEDWREKVVDNRIQPFVKTEIAKMTKTRPQWVGVPKTQSDQDVGAARYAEMALEDAWKRHNMLRKLRAALLWSRCTGAGFWKVWWDKTIGEPRQVLAYTPDHPDPALAGKAVKDTYGKPMDPKLAELPGLENVHVRNVARGDLCIELRTYFQMYVDPLAGEDGLESAEWAGEEAIFSRDYVERHFPDHVDVLDYTAQPHSAAAITRFPGISAGDGQNAKGAKIREYWSKDKHCIWSGDILLAEEPNPYPWLPYVMFRANPVPGRFWPDCPVNHLRPRQVDLNKALSQIQENAQRIGNPPRLVPSSFDEGEGWDGLPGEEVVYQNTGSPNDMPRFMDVPQLPPYVLDLPDRAERSIMEIGGQHEVSGAQVPTGVTAASAINLLQEQDDTRLGPDIADMEEALTHCGTRVLWLIRNLYTDQRHLMVAGEDGQWDVEAFKGDQTEGCDHIEVQAGSGMPQSKAAQQAAIQQVLTLFVQNQIPVPERALRKVLGEYQVGGLEQFFASTSRDEQQVREENRRMALGEQLAINSYDNDGAHIEAHQDFQKTSRYQQLNDKAKAIIEQHVADHRDRRDQMAAQPPGTQMQLPGTTPPGALPPAPGAPSLPASSQTGPPASVLSTSRT